VQDVASVLRRVSRFAFAIADSGSMLVPVFGCAIILAASYADGDMKLNSIVPGTGLCYIRNAGWAQREAEVTDLYLDQLRIGLPLSCFRAGLIDELRNTASAAVRVARYQ
jgi:hypothetical protein